MVFASAKSLSDATISTSRVTSVSQDPVHVNNSAEDTDLLIVGAGTLGCRVGAIWSEMYPEASVFTETLTERSHSKLKAAGFYTRTREQGLTDTRLFRYVLFSAPPSNGYESDVERAVASTVPGGRLVLTSSGAVFENHEFVTENSPCTNTPRAQRLLRAEDAAKRGNAVILRLSGLYDDHHNGICRDIMLGESSWDGDSMSNLVHYEDAARAVVQALIQDANLVEGKEFLITDGSTVSFRQICEEALRLPGMEGFGMPKFLGVIPRIKKVYNNEWSKNTLGWTPVFASYAQWVSSVCGKGRDSPNAIHKNNAYETN